MGARAQHTISGTFSPAADFTYVLAYRLTPTGETYMADAPIKNGSMQLSLPATAAAGIYRLVYAIPKEEFYFDVIYNGKEDIALTFDTDKGAVFTQSRENVLYGNYNRDITAAEKKLIAFYSTPEKKETEFLKIAQELEETQYKYEKSSEGLLAHQFIVGNRTFVPSRPGTAATFTDLRKAHYFDNMEVHDPLLQSSGFLADKSVTYVFRALPLKKLAPAQMEVETRKNLAVLELWAKGAEPAFRTTLFNRLWEEADQQNRTALADHIYATYLKPLALESGQKALVDKIEIHNRLRVGAKAPEITWTDGNGTQQLSGLDKADTFVLAFWSSGCPHCLQEVPQLHKALGNSGNIKVLAIGLEDNDVSWKKEIAHLEGFVHALALGKWDNQYVSLYDVHRTPTYFVLDGDKKILDRPESLEELLSFLKNKRSL
jgi:thiol-disulfide isomerase/thioredoxin